MRLHAEVDRPNLYVKIPRRSPASAAIEDCIAATKSINVTLIFSLDRYKAVVEAYLRGLERLVAGGNDPTTVLSVASFFVSRVDTEADKRLEELGSDTSSRASSRSRTRSSPTSTTCGSSPGRAGSSSRRRARRPQRCLWASTSTKNPSYRDALRRGADRPRHGQHDAGRDDRRVPGSRRGARRHGDRGRRRGAGAARRAGRGGRRLRRRRRDARGGGRAEVRRLASTSCSRGFASSASSW